MKSNKTVKIIIFVALFLSAVILISVMTGAVKETTADTDSVKLPVIMYHSLLKDEKLQNDYTVSPTLFENDLKYLAENGYTTVVVYFIAGNRDIFYNISSFSMIFSQMPCT